MKYLLDTNICIYLIKKKPESVLKIFAAKKPGDILVSSITVSELCYEIAKSSRQNENTVALEQFLYPLDVVDFTSEDALHYGRLREHAERIGKPVGAMDMLIAAQALSRGVVLVTNNVKEFSRIESLLIENWVS